jgi:hypothetical protein
VTGFIDGPAKSQHLMLKRSPHFLRVVKSPRAWDALDQAGDGPAPDEKIFAYKLSKQLGNCHINMGRGRGGFYPISEYQFIPQQPTDEQMRKPALWAGWCSKNQ